MSKTPITERIAAAEPSRHFGKASGEGADAAEFVPAALRRHSPPPLPWLDEGTLRAHFAGLAAGSGLRAAAGWNEAATAAAERAARLPGLAHFHPAQPDATVQGLLEVAHAAARAVSAVTGLDRVSLQPPHLAAAERAALMVARSYFAREEPGRTAVVAPEGHSALAAAARLGLPTEAVQRLPSGDVDLDSLLSAVGAHTAAVVANWLTPAGAIDRQLASIGEVARAHGCLFCVDARGLGASAGHARVANAGADLAWLPLAELCPAATSAALGARAHLTEHLPRPLVGKTPGGYELDDDLPRSIGRLALAPANALDVLALYVQMALLGEPGLRARAERLAAETRALAPEG
ncbi:MAG: aminotransferase class V-fold PLP-dependent enzyme [Candidatus Brocadiae bacterium]|nr:aminotransferase class V-fold PLP-dependent enzyme [Candidatus Brocadiia bacterium]